MKKTLSVLTICCSIALFSVEATAVCVNTAAKCAQESINTLNQKLKFYEYDLPPAQINELCSEGSNIKSLVTVRSHDGQICKQNDHWAAWSLIFCPKTKGYLSSKCYKEAAAKFTKVTNPQSFGDFRDAGYKINTPK